MYSYKLEDHLKSLCEQNKLYENLYSTWTLNKRTCSDLLKNVVIQYPHFSMHDASHADTVISNMEMLLGERVKRLSPTDTWLLLHAAYAHDLGMVVEWKAIEAVWTQESFQEELDRLETLPDNDLRKAVQFVRSIHNLEQEKTWPLEASRYVRLINAAIFRGKHSQISQEYIDFCAPELGLDLGHSGMISPRLVKLLGQICMLHTMPLDCVLKLKRITDGYNSTYAHPRFIAMMLRLGDLLDIDNGRFNIGSIIVIGGLPESSQPHFQKHEATTHFLITPEEICFRSNCPDNASYLEARTFVNWLEQEVNFLTINWSKIVPEDLGGYAPHFDEKELLINGVPDIEGMAGLRLTISQDKAFQIIEGAHIYDDPLVFLREVLQNSLDATKLQLWKDLCTDTYISWMGAVDVMHLQMLQPYDIDEKIYANYPITVEVSTIDDNRMRIEVTDRGTGISVEDFKQMCNVGVSNESSEQLRTTLRKMPNWLRPTAGFGIGMQSIFLLTDKFTIDTCTGQETYHAVVYSQQKGGYLQLTRSQKSMPRGTRICIETSLLKSIILNTYDFTAFINSVNIAPLFDPIDSDNNICENYILNIVANLFVKPLFPIHIKSQRNVILSSQNKDNNVLLSIGGKDWILWENRYWCKWQPSSGSVLLWDKQEAILETLKFSSYRILGQNYRFKGVPMASFGSLTKPAFTMDIYGMDTKNNITLSRYSFTEKGKQHISRLHHQYVRIACDVLLQELQNQHFDPYLGFATQGKFRNLDPYLLWLVCDIPQKSLIPKKVIQMITAQVSIYKRVALSKEYRVASIPVRELVLNTIETAPCLLSSLYLSWLDSLFSEDETTLDFFVYDKNFIEKLRDSYYVGSLEIINFQTHSITLCTWQDSVSPIQVSPFVRSRILLSMQGGSLNISYLNGLSPRSATFAIKGYEPIAVRTLPAMIRKPDGINSAWMICPFTSDDELKRKKQRWSKEAFINHVLTSGAFPRVVDWVERHSIHEIPPSRDEIINAYKELIGEYYNVVTEEEKGAIKKELVSE